MLDSLRHCFDAEVPDEPEVEALVALCQSAGLAVELSRGLRNRSNEQLAAIDADFPNRVPLPQVADRLCLSESRLSHLFVDEIGIPLRTYQLWQRYRFAFSRLSDRTTLTHLASDTGFADAAHLTRTFVGYSPGTLYRMTSPWFGRTNVLQEKLDALCRGKTFGDLRGRSRGLHLLVTATDLTTGAAFEFTPEQFALICSDLSSVPLSFAVAASSSVPILLSPVTLRNYAGACPRAAQLADTVRSDRNLQARMLHANAQTISMLRTGHTCILWTEAWWTTSACVACWTVLLRAARSTRVSEIFRLAQYTRSY